MDRLSRSDRQVGQAMGTAKATNGKDRTLGTASNRTHDVVVFLLKTLSSVSLAFLDP